MKIKYLFATFALFCASHTFAETVSFNWQHKRAMVTETQSKQVGDAKAETLTTRYPIELKAHGENWLLDFGEMEIVAANQQKLNPLEQAMLKKMLNGQEKYPDIVVDKTGIPMEIVDFDGYLKNLSLQTQHADILPWLDTNPEVKEALYFKSLTKPWCLWVCNWAATGYDFQSKPSHDGNQNEVMGIPYQQKETYSLLKKQGDMLTLEIKISIQMDSPDQLLGKSLSDEEKATIQKANMSGNSVLQAVIHRKTGEPQRVEYTQTVSAQNKPVRTESAIYEFEWLK